MMDTMFYKISILIFLTFCITVSLCQDIKRTGQQPKYKDQSRSSLNVTPISAGVTPQQMVETLLGSGVSYSNLQYTGASVASGIFSGGLAAGINIDEGVILSSGAAQFAIGPNNSSGASQGNNQPGDPDLNNLGYSTNDASVLEFDFIPELDYISFSFVIGSEEYPEFIVGYPDVFAFFLNGTNIATIPGTNITISIGTVNHQQNSQYYIHNEPPAFDTQCDGFTVVFNLYGSVTPNVVNHIKMAVADVNDQALDTWIFLQKGSFVSANPELNVEPANLTKSLCPNTIGTESFTLINDGTGELTYSIDDSQSWLNVFPLSGSIAEGQSESFTVTFNSNSLSPGAYQGALIIANNTPANPFNLPTTLNVLPNSSSFSITQDNENNELTGTPDGDFNTYLCKGDTRLPVEFNFFIEQSLIVSAELKITSYDVDVIPAFGIPFPEVNEVYINGNYIGTLTGADETESVSVFNVPGAYLIPGPDGKNLVQIFVSTKGKYWCLEMRAAEIIVTHCQ
jgi:hypothetical protein